MTLRCIIAEDEPLALERLQGYARQLPLLQLLKTFDDAPSALSFLLENPVELLFLDINLGGMSGIELLETSAVSCQVILTTAHPEYAIKAYGLKVTDYLLKPFSFARFAQAVERAQERLAKTERSYIFVKTELRLEKVLLSDILYIEGDGDYRRIHTLRKQIMTLQTFGELEQRIPNSVICRVHKSYAVAIDKIESIERDRIRIGQALIPISASYRDKLYSVIGYR